MGLLSTFRLDRDWQAQAQVVPVGGGGVLMCATSLTVVPLWVVALWVDWKNNNNKPRESDSLATPVGSAMMAAIVGVGLLHAWSAYA